jgi:hypothetical protein
MIADPPIDGEPPGVIPPPVARPDLGYELAVRFGRSF